MSNEQRLTAEEARKLGESTPEYVVSVILEDVKREARRWKRELKVTDFGFSDYSIWALTPEGGFKEVIDILTSLGYTADIDYDLNEESEGNRSTYLSVAW